MSRILAYTSPSRSHLFPVIPVLRELSNRGHDVAIRTLEAYVGDLRGLGIDARPLSPRVTAVTVDDWKARSLLEAQELAMQAFARRAPLEAADLYSALGDEAPDILLVDNMAFGALAAAEASGLPWASSMAIPAWLRGPGIAPYGPGLPPLPGPEGAARDAAVAKLAEGPVRNLLGAVNAGRAAAGLESVAEPDAQFFRPPLVLYFTSEPFEYPRASWPLSFRLVGPCLWEPPAPAPAWLNENRRPVVLIATSSAFQDDGRLVSTALEALRHREDLLVIATVPAADPAAFRCPPNARVERFLSHARVLEDAAAVVCHAGMGITQRALAAGVPVCAVPFGRDQFEVGRRVQVGGGGVVLPADDLSTSSLRDALERTLACRPGARKLATAFAAAGGPPAAADAIEELAAASSRAV